jgi:hypothetical protein
MTTPSSALTNAEGQVKVRPGDPVVYRDDGVYRDEGVRGDGWLFFAGTMLGLTGLMRIIDSIWAFTYNGTLPDGLKDGLLGSNLNNYGWTWLIVGCVLILASFMVLVRSQFARWIGFVASGLAALSALTWMPYYPIWSLTYIGLATLTFYALARFGGREA